MDNQPLFSQLSARAVRYFHPNQEPFSYALDHSTVTPVHRLDLSEIEENRLFYVHGSSVPASWMMRVNTTPDGRVVHIWRDLDSDGLVGSIDGIVL